MKTANREFRNVLNETEGLRVSAMYLSKFPVTGTILHTRVKYGGNLEFRIAAEDVYIWGERRDTLLLKVEEITEFLD